MASNDVNLGIGAATGMFLTAAANSDLPQSIADISTANWTEVGAISADGITYAMNIGDTLRNWAKQSVRRLPGDQGGTVTAPIIDTTEETLRLLFGDDVSTVAASTAHGEIVSVDIGPDTTSSPAAFLFVMKDGDDAMLLGTKNGMVTNIGDVAFNGNAITWEATIEADEWTFSKDNGQKTT